MTALADLYRQAADIVAANPTMTACNGIAWATEEVSRNGEFADLMWAKAHRLFCDYFRPDDAKPVSYWWDVPPLGADERIFALHLMAEVVEYEEANANRDYGDEA